MVDPHEDVTCRSAEASRGVRRGLYAQRIVASNHFDIEPARMLKMADAGIESWTSGVLP